MFGMGYDLQRIKMLNNRFDIFFKKSKTFGMFRKVSESLVGRLVGAAAAAVMR